MICFLFAQKIGFDISCKLSPLGKIAWNVQTCFLGDVGAGGKKTISVCRLLKSLPKVLCVNAYAGNIGSSVRLFVIPDI